MVVVLVLLTVVTLLTIDYLVKRRAQSRVPLPLMIQSRLLSLPGDVYLAPGHAWARPCDNRTLRIGAGRLPLHALGSPDGVRMPQVGSKVLAGEPLVTLRQGSRSLLLRSPVDGEIDQVNRAVIEQPQRITVSPFGDGWLCTIRPRSLSRSLRRMFLAEEATVWMRRELARLRETLGRLSQPATATTPLQLDGGIPAEGLANHLDDAQWTEIQQFFDRSTGD